MVDSAETKRIAEGIEREGGPAMARDGVRGGRLNQQRECRCDDNPKPMTAQDLHTRASSWSNDGRFSEVLQTVTPRQIGVARSTFCRLEWSAIRAR